jgi:hypothetical protein
MKHGGETLGFGAVGTGVASGEKQQLDAGPAHIRPRQIGNRELSSTVQKQP